MAEKDGAGPSINIGSIEGGQNNIGHNEIHGDQVQNVGGQEPLTIDRFADAIASTTGMPETLAEDTAAAIQSFAKLPKEEQVAALDTEKWKDLAIKIQPYAKSIWKSVAVFGAAALKALASRNPVVAGVMAVCEQQKETESDPYESQYHQQEQPYAQGYQDGNSNSFWPDRGGN